MMSLRILVGGNCVPGHSMFRHVEMIATLGQETGLIF